MAIELVLLCLVILVNRLINTIKNGGGCKLPPFHLSNLGLMSAVSDLVIGYMMD